MIYSVRVSELAVCDMKMIHDYIAQELSAPDTARRQIARIETAIRNLDHFPYRYRKASWNNPSLSDVRIMPIDNYAVLFTPNKEDQIVYVTRVVYSHRDLNRL